MSIQASKIVARYKAASKYDLAFQTMVQIVDDLEAAMVKIPRALDALNDLDHHIKTDPDVLALQGLTRYAPEQQINFLIEKFTTAQKAVRELAEQYEESNKSFMRMKLR